MLRGSDDYDCCFVLPRMESEWTVDGGIELRPTESAGASGDETKAEDGRERRTFVKLVRRLAASGLEYASFLSVQGDEIYVKVRIPQARLEIQADLRDFKLKLDPGRLADTLARGLPDAGIGPIAIGTECDGEAVSFIGPHEHIYGKFDTHPDLRPLYEVPDGCATPFRSMHRCKLIADIIASNRRFGGMGLVLDKKILDGEVLAFLPLHDAVERSALFNAWVKAPWLTLPNSLPFTRYRNYFGEQAAMYLVWKAHVTQFELVLAVVGVGTECLVRYHGFQSDVAHWAHAVFGFVVCVWSSSLLVCWRRRERRTALEWGMTDFEQDQPPRPQFKGALVRSPVSGAEEIYFLKRRRRGPRLVGAIVTGAMIACTVGFMLLMQLFKHQEGFSEKYTTLPAVACNAIGIQIFTYAYQAVAIKLTEHENWRTETAYADQLILRLFIFNGINSYAYLYFVAFLQTSIPNDRGLGANWVCMTGPSGKPDCLYDLGYNNMFIMITSLITTVLMSTVIPLVSRRRNEWREKGEHLRMSAPEWQYLLIEYDETLDNIYEYMYGALAYGYVILFSVAAPLTVAVGAALNLIVLRLDAYKYLTGYRRIEPRGVQDIGSFGAVYRGLNVAAAFTNSAIIVYLPHDFIGDRFWNKDAAYLVAVLVMTACGSVAEAVAGYGHGDIDLQIARQKFISEKVVDRVADEEEKYALDRGAVADATFAASDAAGTYAALREVMLRAPRATDLV